MPKKVQHKGKLKSALEESESLVFRTGSNETIEEDYTTVVDFESNKKYNKRLIKNNWSKYEAAITSVDNSDDGNEQPKTDDFNFLLKTASSDCSHFQFSSEKQWSNVNTVPASEIFNLDLRTLSSGLACIPFYERIGLDESHLTVEDKKRFDREAEENLKEYNLIREKSKKCESDIKNLNKPINVELDLSDKKVENKSEENLEEVQSTNKSETEAAPVTTKKLFFSENDENLEDWLDSVLDD